ncbi:MAG: hypothetical protein JWM12_2648 [Ilumatobacteraceae bacterium]|jgi:hypothetical protein|nr:hypothetical protein [Ilumatobacteraceae bacterium]
MPWCEDCAKYFAPSAMHADGTCPTCGRSLERTQAESNRRKRRGHASPNVPADPEGSVADGAPDADAPAGEPITAKNLNLHKLAAGEGGDEDDMRAPWHFKLLLVLLALYLTWRVIQLFA